VDTRSLAHTDGITIYGTTTCPDTRRARQFLGDHQINYDFVDIEANVEGLSFVLNVNGGARAIPTIVFGDGSILVDPSEPVLVEKLGLLTE
jgi:glutaredoxin